jgi:hypothetical protein
MSLKKIGTKLALIAVGTVIIGGACAVHIPIPYGPILGGLIGIGGGLWIRSFFSSIK